MKRRKHPKDMRDGSLKVRCRYGFGKEYWKSRLAPQGEPLGRVTKTLTHRKERRASKRMERA